MNELNVVAAIVLGVLNEVLRTFSEYRMLGYSDVFITFIMNKFTL
ncbi:MAG: hypothetical protein RR618_03595 [Cellulosilyticaceae bacterium]